MKRNLVTWYKFVFAVWPKRDMKLNLSQYYLNAHGLKNYATVEIHLNVAFVKSTETSYEIRQLFSLISKCLISMIIRWNVFIHIEIPAQ